MPHFTHDCPKCIFLGSYSDEHYEKADLYWCQQIGTPTVIARFGSDGPDYSSGMIFADQGINAALVEAKRRAVERGLPTQPINNPP